MLVIVPVVIAVSTLQLKFNILKTNFALPHHHSRKTFLQNVITYLPLANAANDLCFLPISMESSIAFGIINSF